MTKGKQTVRQRMIINRHKASIELPKSAVTELDTMDGSGKEWLVQSSNEPEKCYHVVNNGKMCKNLNCMIITYPDCNIGVHEFVYHSHLGKMQEKVKNSLLRLYNMVTESEDIDAICQLNTQLIAAENTFATVQSDSQGYPFQ